MINVQVLTEGSTEDYGSPKQKERGTLNQVLGAEGTN